MVFVPSSKRKVGAEIAKSIVDAIHRAFPTPQHNSLSSQRKRKTLEQTIENSHNNMSNHDKHLTDAASHLQQLVQQSSPCPLVVGVFANQTSSEINEIVEQVGLDLIQLHGDVEQEKTIESALNKPIIRAIHVTPLDDAASVMKRIKPGWE